MQSEPYEKLLSMDAARIGLKCAACQCYDRDQRTYGCLAMYMIHMRRAPLHRGTYQGSDAAREICGLRLSALFISLFFLSLFSGGPLEKYICVCNHDLRHTFLCTNTSAIWTLSLYLSRSAYLFAPAARVPHHLASRIASRSDASTSATGIRTPA